MKSVTSQPAPGFLTTHRHQRDTDQESFMAFFPPCSENANDKAVAANARDAAAIGAAVGVGAVKAAIKAAFGVHQSVVSAVMTSLSNSDTEPNPAPTIHLTRQATAAELAAAREQMLG